MRLFNTSDYLGKSKGLSLKYDKNMKIELFKKEGEDAELELIETFTLDNVADQYKYEIEY